LHDLNHRAFDITAENVLELAALCDEFALNAFREQVATFIGTN
jgi:hypothetical protein